MARKRKIFKRKRGRHKSGTSLFGRILKWALVLILWSVLILGGLFAWYARELPDITRSAAFQKKPAITILAADGTVVTRYGEIKGEKIGIDDLPPHLIQAVLAIEDRRFYKHHGIDPAGLARALAVNIRNLRWVQGGSTITQQLAKNLFLSRERTLKRKIQEAMLAVWLEMELSKDEILSAYLNRVYMGSGTYGVDAAARLYFGKAVGDLSLRESAILAGLLKAPSRYSPLNNPHLARERADTVLAAMVESGYLLPRQAGELISAAPPPMQKPTGADAARYFTDWVVDGLDDLIGTPDRDLVITTTFDPALQDAAETTLAAILRGDAVDKKVTQGAITVMRPDGAVIAMVGGLDYGISQFNRATQAKRQPGSAFKPVLYLTALEYGWKPGDLILDEPFTEGRYKPENFAGEYFGEVTLEEALARSLNTAAVRLMQALGPAAVQETAKRLGIFSPLEPDLSLALGSSGVSQLEMTTAYAVLANGGYGVFPYAITRIAGTDGTLYYERAEFQNVRRVVADRPLKSLVSMMQTVVERGTAQAARLPVPAAGKTGTTQNSRDAWFIGFTDRLVASVWMGNDDNTPTAGVTGGTYPARIWKQIMLDSQDRYAPVGSRDFADPGGGIQGLIGRILGGGDGGGSPKPAGQPHYNE